MLIIICPCRRETVTNLLYIFRITHKQGYFKPKCLEESFLNQIFSILFICLKIAGNLAFTSYFSSIQNGVTTSRKKLDMPHQRTALLSVYDKEGLETFARQLTEMGWNILASAGTTKYLTEKGIPARNVAEIVGIPILGHRVVTLSREIHAALLAQDTPEDNAELERLNIPRIDLVYVNFYPLEEEIKSPQRTLESVIEKTDIGGPTLLRSAAKGRRLAVSSPEQLADVLNYLREFEPTMKQSDKERFISRLAYEAEWDVSDYCKASAKFHRDFKDGEI